MISLKFVFIWVDVLTASWEFFKTLGVYANLSFQKIQWMCLDAQTDLDEVTRSSMASQLWQQSTLFRVRQGDLPSSLQSPQMAVFSICLLSVLLLFCFLPLAPSLPLSETQIAPHWTYCPDPVPSIAEPHLCIFSGRTLAPSQLLSLNSFLNSLNGSLICRARGSEQ